MHTHLFIILSLIYFKINLVPFTFLHFIFRVQNVITFQNYVGTLYRKIFIILFVIIFQVSTKTLETCVSIGYGECMPFLFKKKIILVYLRYFFRINVRLALKLDLESLKSDIYQYKMRLFNNIILFVIISWNLKNAVLT